jgi:hypothetical protein
MNLRDLALAAMRGDDVMARQWVKDALRTGLNFSALTRPDDLDPETLAVAASLAELLAQRRGQAARAALCGVEAMV